MFLREFTAMSQNSIKKQILPILIRGGVTKAALFGSAARGEMKKNSDIDLLVNIEKKKTFLDFVGLKLELEEKLEKKVDIVEYSAIKPNLREFILSEQMVIYDQKKP